MIDRTAPLSRSVREAFYEDARRGLRQLELDTSGCLAELDFAAQRYATNVLRETKSVTDARLLRELAETIELGDERISRRVGIWSDDLVSAFCRELPGHNAVLSTLGAGGGEGGQNGRHVHLTGPLFDETLENVQRNTANETKLAKVTFEDALERCLPARVDEGLVEEIYRALLDETGVEGVAPRTRGLVLRAVSEYLIGLGTTEDEGARRRMLSCSAKLPDIERRKITDLLLAQFLQAWREEPGADDRALQRFSNALASTALAAVSAPSRRKLIGGIAALFPADFRRGLTELRSGIKEQYGGQGDEHGKSRSTWLWRSGHAKWILISDVLDVVWPPSRGPLGEDSRRFEPACVEDIVHQTHGYAVHIVAATQGEAAARRARAPVNGDHIKLVSRWRAQIYELQEVVLVLDRQILEAERLKLDPMRADDDRQQARAGEQHLRRQLEPILAWQRELKRMLRQADYEKGKQGASKKRPAGPKIPLPEFDMTWRRLSPTDKLAAIAAAAMGHSFIAQ